MEELLNMNVFEIIGGVLLIVTCLLAVILCLLQDSKQQQNMTAAITGGANDSFYEKNAEPRQGLPDDSGTDKQLQGWRTKAGHIPPSA